MKVKICPKCGAESTLQSLECWNCGKDLRTWFPSSFLGKIFFAVFILVMLYAVSNYN